MNRLWAASRGPRYRLRRFRDDGVCTLPRFRDDGCSPLSIGLYFAPFFSLLFVFFVPFVVSVFVLPFNGCRRPPCDGASTGLGQRRFSLAELRVGYRIVVELIDRNELGRKTLCLCQQPGLLLVDESGLDRPGRQLVDVDRGRLALHAVDHDAFGFLRREHGVESLERDRSTDTLGGLVDAVRQTITRRVMAHHHHCDLVTGTVIGFGVHAAEREADALEQPADRPGREVGEYAVQGLLDAVQAVVDTPVYQWQIVFRPTVVLEAFERCRSNVEMAERVGKSARQFLGELELAA